MKGKHVKSENIIKKVVCMVLMVMMLTSNIITPVTLLADELSGDNIEQSTGSDSENETSENNTNSANSNENSNANSGADHEGNVDSDSANQQSDAGSGPDAQNSANNTNESQNTQENVSDDSGANNVNGTSNVNGTRRSNNSEQNENQGNGENTTISNASQTDNALAQGNSLMLRNVSGINMLNANNNLANTSNANDIATTVTPKELDDATKATTKEDIEDLKQNDKYKTKNDNYEIRTFETQFLSGASKDSNGNLVWTASNTAKGHEFTFRVNYALSGYGELPAGSVQITIPKQILRNRAGNLDDTYIMSLPTLQECEEEGEMAELIYKEDGDYLVIYNPQEVEAGLNGYFEISYATNSPTYNYKDYDTASTDLVKNGGTASDDFYAIMALNVEKDSNNSENNEENSETEVLNNITENKNVFINTTAILQSTQKRYPTLYTNYNSSWMQEAPENSGDYYYLVWEITSYISNSTQKYNFTLEDFVTDLTEGTSEGDYEFVGYKLAGERYFSDKNTVTNQVADGYRYDYVLTRHKKSVYAEKTIYKLKNTITATVHPIDGIDSDTNATSSNTFTWTPPTFTRPTGHFNLFKYGNNTGFGGRYANYDLDKLQSEEVNYLRNFKYQTETVGYAYPWTLRDGGSSSNPGDYGVNEVTYDTWDDTLYLEGDETPMNTDDYYLEYFTYSISNSDAEYDTFNMRFYGTSVSYGDNEVVTFYAKFGDRNEQSGNDWIEIGTYNLKTKALTPNTDYVQSMTTSKITFKQGVHATGWRFSTTNKHYSTDITVTPYFVLTNSDYVKTKIKDETGENKSSIRIQNNVSTKIKDHNENTIFSKTTYAIDYARVTYYDSNISKTVASVANKKVKKKYTITWRVNAWEKATSGEGFSEYIPQESGKFYDLIPLGGELDTKSIQVQAGSRFLSENEYSYELIPNYDKSGRSMLIVTINEQADYYNVYYTTVHSWESMKDFGKNVLNPVAYETGNEKITHGYADNGGNLSLLNKILMNDLDKTTDDKKFLYSERSYNINALTAAISGLHKKVKNSTDEDYSYSTEVEPGETYTYKLRFENTFMNSARNLVFFDSLENFKVVDTEAGTEKTSGWHGTLKSIELTQLKQKGIDAKVYISIQKNIDPEDHNDLTDTSIWQLATEETDLSTAKAIAIDMTKTAEGEDFVLASGDSVTATLYMQAPEATSEEIEQNQYAYNNVYMQNTLIDELDETVDYFIHQDYTTIKYRVVADVPFQKVNEQNKEEGIKGITFRLKGTSIYGNEVDENITSPNDGYITFKSIEAGEYILQEYEGTPDWIEDHTEHTVKINIDKSVYIDDQLVTKETPFKITNEPRAHTDVTIYKKDLVNKSKAVEGAKFKLSGTSEYGNEVLMYAISDSNGKVTFENIEKGKYDLIEVSTVEGYTLNEYNKETFKVIVDENSNYDVQKHILVDTTEQVSYETIYDNGIYPIYNEPLHNFSYTKKNLVDKNVVVPNVTFKVTGTSDYGNYFEKTASSDENGKVTFDGLEKGTYTLTEIDTPSNYVLNTETYTVTIDKMNNFTISGSHMAEIDGKYEIYNEPKHSFYFTKKDKYNNQNLGGAKFKLYGTSNIGNTYDEEATSVAGTGIVTFDNLESGTYFLKEIETPDTAETSYKLDEEERIVEVSEDGTVTLDNEVIWPLSERNENNPYIWYNTRNKGQITITKKWVDNLTNDQREEPKIYISTKRGELAYSKVYFRTADSTHSIIDYVTSENVTAFKRDIKLSEQDVLAKNPVRLDNDYSNNNSEYKIYAWLENGTLYWWTKADRAVLPANLDYYFNNETGLTDVSFTGIKAGEYWTGTSGAETTATSITNMQNMFYNCTSITNLDISSLNNSGIEDSANMQYAFGNNGSTPAGAMTALKYITIGNNFKLFDTSVLPKGKWKNQTTNEEKTNTDLTGTLTAGTYEYVKTSVKVGDTVKYSPSGTYQWDAEYATAYASTDSNYTSNTKTLNSGDKTAASANNFHIEEWKVLSVDESTGKIEIVPSLPTTGRVLLQGAQGYNNAVKLLNDACSSLYSDTSKGITARSINMDDIEKVMKEEGQESSITAPTQTSGTYDSSNSKYPVIYGMEKLSTVNSSGTLGLSEQTRLIERSEGTSTSSNIGAITTRSSMTIPYGTGYYLSNRDFKTALGSRSSILLPNGSSTRYGVASRCVAAISNICGFFVCSVRWGDLDGSYMFDSGGYTDYDVLGLFPVVSLSSDLLNKTETDGEYQVE